MSRLADIVHQIIEEEKIGSVQPTVDGILDERHGRYGTFAEQALIAQNLKSALRHTPNWKKLPADMKEALEMMASKTARILNGDFTYDDSWADIAGYAQLIVDKLNGKAR